MQSRNQVNLQDLKTEIKSGYITKDNKGKLVIKNLNIKQPKEPEWCPDCSYVLVLENGKCKKCQEIRLNAYYDKKSKLIEENKIKLNVANKIGGMNAYNQYTEDKFENKQIFKQCSYYPNCNLFIYGNTGVGKTHLATALIRKIYPNFVKVKPMQIFRKMRNCENVQEEEDIINMFSKTNLLIDDFGVEKITEYAFQTIYEIIDNRYELGNNGLIITSNLSLDGLAEKLDNDRISSRIADMCKIIKLEGSDYRLK